MSILADIKYKLVFFDGAMGTQLQNYGILPGECSENWNLTHSDVITKIHKEYFEAGANIATANTFGANPLKIPNTKEVVYAALSNAKRAITKKGQYVALDIGPTGKLLKPLGDLAFEDAVESFGRMVKAGSEADLILIETMSDTYELKAAVLGARGATVNFVGAVPAGTVAVDVGRIHYEDWFFQGTATADCSAAFGRNVRSTLKKGGTCWLPGGAGAMGQMHTQMAVENPNGPARIIVSDLDSNRIENVKRQLKDTIAARNIEFVAINPSEMTPEEFEQKLNDFAPDGFDDIVMLVPVVPILASAAKHLGKDGLMNIFAGIPAGKTAELDISGIAYDGMRFVGSSGSKTAHLRHTLELAESGKLKPVTALAAIGGMKDLKKGLEAVINAKFPGNTVIFPNCVDMPLVAVNELEKLGSDIAATVDEAGYYTMATEKAIKERF